MPCDDQCSPDAPLCAVDEQSSRDSARTVGVRVVTERSWTLHRGQVPLTGSTSPNCAGPDLGSVLHPRIAGTGAVRRSRGVSKCLVLGGGVRVCLARVPTVLRSITEVFATRRSSRFVKPGPGNSERAIGGPDWHVGTWPRGLAAVIG